MKAAAAAETNNNSVPSSWLQVQCEGPGCRKPSRPGSKYCCHTCGLERARHRLMLVLPYRIEAFCQSLPQSTLRDAAEIVELKQKLEALREKSAEFIEVRAFLLNFVEGLAKMPYPKAATVKKGKGPDVQGHCHICGFVTQNWPFLQRHIDRCYLRIESESNVTGPSPAEFNPDGFICDHYCEATGVYCKRLKVVCFEHKSKVLPNKKLCGAPLELNMATLDWNKPFDRSLFSKRAICRLAETDCTEHQNWARDLISFVDSTRLNVDETINDIVERIETLKSNMNRCYDIPTLLETFTLSEDTDEYGLPKRLNYTKNKLPARVRTKVNWKNELDKIDEAIAPVLAAQAMELKNRINRKIEPVDPNPEVPREDVPRKKRKYTRRQSAPNLQKVDGKQAKAEPTDPDEPRPKRKYTRRQSGPPRETVDFKKVKIELTANLNPDAPRKKRKYTPRNGTKRKYTRRATSEKENALRLCAVKQELPSP